MTSIAVAKTTGACISGMMSTMMTFVHTEKGKKMSRYVRYEDVAYMALQSMNILNGEWANAMQGLSTIDIVRCRECKHYHVEKYHTYCDFLNIRGMFPPDPHPDDFCSYGSSSEKPNNLERSSE